MSICSICVHEANLYACVNMLNLWYCKHEHFPLVLCFFFMRLHIFMRLYVRGSLLALALLLSTDIMNLSPPVLSHVQAPDRFRLFTSCICIYFFLFYFFGFWEQCPVIVIKCSALFLWLIKCSALGLCLGTEEGLAQCSCFSILRAPDDTIHFIWFTKYYLIHATKRHTKIQFRLGHLVLCVHACTK